MKSDIRIDVVAKVARTLGSELADGAHPISSSASILSLAAASYGAKPSADSTVPTGFDPVAVQLFEAIIEGAFLVAKADGHLDDAERHAFELVVASACGGAVAPKQVTALIGDLEQLLASDGPDARAKAIGTRVMKAAHAHEVVRIAALLAESSDGVSDVERAVIEKIAQAVGLQSGDVDQAIARVRQAIAETSDSAKTA